MARRILKKPRVKEASFQWSPDLLNVLMHQLDMDSVLPETLQDIAASVKDLSDYFLESAGQPHAFNEVYGDRPQFLKAYSAYYLLANIPKIIEILNEIPVSVTASRQIIDLGSGPGTGALAVLIAGHLEQLKTSLAITAVDRSGAFLDTAGQLIGAVRRQLQRPGQDTMIHSDINAFLSELPSRVSMVSRGDLVLMCNVLSELSGDVINTIPRKLDQWFQPGARLICMEPAQRVPGRKLLWIRDSLCRLNWRVLYPCPGNDLCPALKKRRQWCHHRLKWQAPYLIRQIDNLTGMHKKLLNFSPVVMEKPIPDQLDPKTSELPGFYRVVSEVRPLKGKLEVKLCGFFNQKYQFKTMMLENKRLSGTNKLFSELVRYDRIRIEGAEIRGDRLILSETSRLSRATDC